MKNAKVFNKILNILIPILTLLTILAIWFIGAYFVDESIILPSPKETFSSLIKYLIDLEFYNAYFMTLFRSLLAFLLSFLVAFALALLSKFNFVCKKISGLIISILRALPTVAVILLFLLWTSSKTSASILVTMLVVLPTTYTAVYSSLCEVDEDLIVTCKLYNVSKKDLLFKVYIPQILPSMMLAIGAGFSLNLKLMVAAEVLAVAPNSIGRLMNNSKIYFETANLMALVIAVVVTGIVVEAISSILSKRFRRWK